MGYERREFGKSWGKFIPDKTVLSQIKFFYPCATPTTTLICFQSIAALLLLQIKDKSDELY